jgi:hypothetical protein
MVFLRECEILGNHKLLGLAKNGNSEYEFSCLERTRTNTRRRRAQSENEIQVGRWQGKYAGRRLRTPVVCTRLPYKGVVRHHRPYLLGLEYRTNAISVLFDSAQSDSKIFKDRSESKYGATSELAKATWKPSRVFLALLFPIDLIALRFFTLLTI